MLEFTNNIVFLSLKIDFVQTNSEDPGEMWYFIWVFTVHQSVRYGVSGLKRVKVKTSLCVGTLLLT